jgi:capsular polysaccharide biosynthesis protein
VTESVRRQDDIDFDRAAVTNRNGSARSQDAGGPAASAPHRTATSIANLRLALLAVVIVMVGACAGYFGSLLLPEQYAARAELWYHLSRSQPNELLREDRILTTQLVMLQSQTVLEPLAHDHGMRPEDLRENVSAKVVDNSEIIEIEVRERRPERAQTLLDGLLDRYLAIANSDSVLASPPQPSTGVQAASGPPARILAPSYLVDRPVSPKPLLAAVAGAAVGFVLAALTVLMIARRRLRS